MARIPKQKSKQAEKSIFRVALESNSLAEGNADEILLVEAQSFEIVDNIALFYFKSEEELDEGFSSTDSLVAAVTEWKHICKQTRSSILAELREALTKSLEQDGFLDGFKKDRKEDGTSHLNSEKGSEKDQL